MKEQQLDTLEERTANTRKIKTPNVRGGKYKGNPYMKFKKIKTQLRQKIRQLLRTSIPLEDLNAITKTQRIAPSH